VQITETVTRECCAPADWRALEDSPLMTDGQPVWMFCRHCGRRRKAEVEPSADWMYREQPMPWEGQ